MVERIGREGLPEIQEYLLSYCHENIQLVNDLRTIGSARDSSADTLSLVGYRHEGAIIAAQGFYRHGRWLPHFVREIALSAMIDDMRQRPVRWIMGIERVVKPILQRLSDMGFGLVYDERDYLCYVDGKRLCPHETPGVRRATRRDSAAIARLRFSFEVEYFRVPAKRVNRSWCLHMARRYVREGTYLVEREGQVVSMAATEARAPGLAQIGAVYTQKGYRSRGLAKGVVWAICRELLQDCDRVTLTVDVDNAPALKAYAALGFQRWDDYRMSRFRRDGGRRPRCPSRT